METKEIESQEQLKKEALSGCFSGIILLMLTPFSAWWSGAVMLKIYNWFIFPIQGAPPMTLGNMLGFSLLISMCIAGWSKNEKTDKNTWNSVFVNAIAKAVTYPTMFLFFGWLYQMWFMH